jgi:hypothetical protein
MADNANFSFKKLTLTLKICEYNSEECYTVNEAAAETFEPRFHVLLISRAIPTLFYLPTIVPFGHRNN